MKAYETHCTIIVDVLWHTFSQRQWYPCATINADWLGPQPFRICVWKPSHLNKRHEGTRLQRISLASKRVARKRKYKHMDYKEAAPRASRISQQGRVRGECSDPREPLIKYNSKWKERRGRYRPKAFATHSSFVWFLLHLSRQLNNMVIASLALLIPLNAWYMPTIFRLQHCLSPFISPSLQR